ncbi:GGDEF domain-containing protein [Variovorax sp. YR752]|uniref:GGDEF domain-containing protein n=1 Tax=Variovorax sp. YR752 TaxID=1884383 RepID=UPI00313841E7
MPALATTVRPASLLAIDNLIDDDPRAAIVAARAQLVAAGGPAERFWALLGLARAQNMLELSAEAGESLAEAETALVALAASTPAHRAWLEKTKLESEWMALETRDARERMDRLQQTATSIDDAELACELQQLDLVLLVDVNTLDEAWLTAEAVERCARELGLPSLESGALLSMGTIAGRGQARTQAEADQHFERALKALGTQPARMTRSLVLWERANAMGIARQWDESARWFEEARELSRSIDDRAGIAAANTGLAEAFNQRKQPARALPLVAEARRLVEDTDTGYRMFVLAEQSIVALTLLGRAEVIAEIGRARRWDTPAVPAAARARVARAMAAGFASQGRFAQAYAETQRAELLHEEGRAFAADVQTLRLQARYAAAQRDAENTELRHQGERTRLALEAETARQRSLWAAIATLGLMTAAALAFGWRAFLRRRALADLALRDELTGAPNRRAVRAYAQAQLDQARRLDVPLTLALIDLDHFKRVNDTRGHAAGDAVLCALATAAAAVLRGQDRLGRWGGEEWLLVMPGTSVDEVPAVFDRLRQRFALTPAAGIDGAHGCTFSMGAAALARHTDSLDALIDDCDRQLYRAKQEGRDRLCFAQ